MSKAVPKHVGFIMDGNRRWARMRNLPAVKGHSQGADVIKPLVELASEKQIEYLTFWAFSTENWKRNQRELSFLMRLFRNGINGKHTKELLENNVRLRVIGDIDAFPKDIARDVWGIVKKSEENTGITVTMALNYGGREEILQAVQRFASDVKRETDNIEIDASRFEKYLYTHDLPDPDMIIRTGGEKRLSGYLPWQSVYSELYFTDVFWPDFTVGEFEKALDEYERRERRFGK